MANFTPGWTYANRDYILYSTGRKKVVTNKQKADLPEIDWTCQSRTKTFATFLDETMTVQRRKIYRDDNGSFVYPYGRYPGAPVLRAEYAYNNGTLVADADYGQDNDNAPSPTY
jgi:hypothetical protein